MKSEIVNVRGKGLCILISDINVNDILQGMDTSNIPTISIKGQKTYLSNINLIVQAIRDGKKIAAIKELRVQTGWGLKDSKEYIDKFMKPPDIYSSHEEKENHYEECASRFLNAHQHDDFIENDEFKI